MQEFQFQTGMSGGLSSGVVGLGGGSGGKMPAILREFLSSLDDKEWQSELYKLLQSQSFNQVEVDLFELLCKVLDHNLFAQVDWARNSFYFKELKVGRSPKTLLLLELFFVRPIQTPIPFLLSTQISFQSSNKVKVSFTDFC